MPRKRGRYSHDEVGEPSGSGSASASSASASTSSNVSRILSLISSCGSGSSGFLGRGRRASLPRPDFPSNSSGVQRPTTNTYTPHVGSGPSMMHRLSTSQSNPVQLIDSMMEDPSPIANAQTPEKTFTTTVRIVRKFIDKFDAYARMSTLKCLVYDLWGFLAEVDAGYGLASHYDDLLEEGRCYTLNNCHSAVTFGSLYFVDRPFYVDLRTDAEVYAAPDEAVKPYLPFIFKTLLQISELGPLKERFLVDFVAIVVGLVPGGRPMIMNPHSGDVVCVYLIDRDYCARAAELIIQKDVALKFREIFLSGFSQPFLLLASAIRVHVNAGTGIASLSSTKWSHFSVNCSGLPQVDLLHIWKERLPGPNMLIIQQDSHGCPIMFDKRAENAHMLGGLSSGDTTTRPAVFNHVCPSCGGPFPEEVEHYFHCSFCGSPVSYSVQCIPNAHAAFARQAIPRRTRFSREIIAPDNMPQSEYPPIEFEMLHGSNEYPIQFPPMQFGILWR